MFDGLLGRYRIIEKLGQGTRFHTYKARDEGLSADVVLKVVRLDGDPAPVRERFYATATEAVKIAHPGAGRIIEVGHRRDTETILPGVREFAYIAEEWVSGTPLSSLIPKKDKLVSREVIALMGHVAETFRDLASQGRQHHGLKPSNIVRLADGSAKILDFGIAKLLSTGTLFYMSPEDLSGESLDTRSDLFSWGVVFYELLTGHKAFSGNSFAAVMQSIMKGEYRPPTRVDPALPPFVDLVVAKALAPLPDNRFQTFQDLVMFLQDQAAAKAGSVASVAPVASVAAAMPAVPAVSAPLPVTVPKAPPSETRVSAIPVKPAKDPSPTDRVPVVVAELLNEKDRSTARAASLEGKSEPLVITGLPLPPGLPDVARPPGVLPVAIPFSDPADRSETSIDLPAVHLQEQDPPLKPPTTRAGLVPVPSSDLKFAGLVGLFPPPAATRPLPMPVQGERRNRPGTETDPFFQFLASIPLFDGLAPEIVGKVSAVAKRRHFTTGQEILRQGDPAHGYYILIQGEVDVIQITEGRETVVAHLADGEGFGEMSLLTGEPCVATVRTASPVSLIAVLKADFDEVLNDTPVLAAHFNRVLARRLVKANKSVEDQIERGMVGNLKAISLSELLQAVKGSRRTGTLYLYRQGKKGSIYFEDGEVLDAGAMDQEGEEAVYLLLSWDDGSFRFEQAKRVKERRIHRDIQGLLMEGMRRVDETVRTSKQAALPPPPA